MRVVLLFFLAFFCAFGSKLDYTLIKKGEANATQTLLVIGGIQGDEPGGFFAANLLATEYNITKGSLWVVPNLNFNSIIKNNRGVSGDMNRKFAKIAKTDPDFKAVTNIKDIITKENVKIIVHLHDGSGFYRPKYINNMENPARWGNCAIIDQDSLEGAKYGDLEGIAKQVVKAMNAKITNPKHHYNVKNTHTAQKGSKDAEQLNSLTYFAITKGKAAYANEASKSLDVYTRIYYHLLALEEYMKIAGIAYERSFELSLKGIEEVVEKEIQVSLFNDKIFLALNEPRESLNYIPTPLGAKLWQNYSSDNPLLAIVDDEKNNINVYYANRFLTRLRPQYFSFSSYAKQARVIVDGNDEIIAFGSKLSVKNSIEIKSQENIRVNVIGYEGINKNESDIKISQKDMIKKFSIDKAGKLYRAEFYEQEEGQKDRYIGMFLIEFEG